MNQSNQYQAPQSNVETADSGEYSQVKILGAKGRIGRVRYLAYNFGLIGIGFIAYFIVSMTAMFLPPNMLGLVIGGFMLILSIVSLVINFLFAIQRCHDFNYSGWLSLLIMIPFGFFVLLFIPGTDGSNNYGNPPPPNHAGVIVMAVLAPLIMIVVIGILAAIAIPAYNGYIERAKEAQMMQQ